MRPRISVFPLLLLGLTACPGTVYQANRIPESQALQQPASVNRPGPILHEPSGLEFGEWYGEFERVTAMRFDERGLDVGFGYNLRKRDCLIATTFYVYPAPRMSFMGAAPEVVSSVEADWLAQEFARSRAEVEYYHHMESPEVQPCSTTADGATLPGTALTFRERNTTGELKLFVYRHQWFLKYRFTYGDACGDVQPRLEKLIAGMPWVAR